MEFCIIKTPALLLKNKPDLKCAKATGVPSSCRAIRYLKNKGCWVDVVNYCSKMGRERLKFEPMLHSANKWLHCALHVGSCRSREFLTASQFLIFTMNFVITNSKKSKKNLTRLPLRKVQFSCWTHSNPNRPKIVHEKLIIYIFNPNAYTLKIKLKEHIIDSALVSNPCLMLQIIIIFNSVCLDLLKTFMHWFILFKYACIVSY